MGEANGHLQVRQNRLKIYAWVAALVWGLALALSYWINVSHQREVTLEVALASARASYSKDLAFRHWVSSHGGVYVPITEDTPPNPYLEVPNRDVTTDSGQELTLLNPAYAYRQLLNEHSAFFGIYGRLTSLRPINPENLADPWERRALMAIEEGKTQEVFEIRHLKESVILRFLRPVYIEPGCLACHAKQGYQIGDVRGAISLSIPMQRYLELEAQSVLNHRIYHLILLLVGFVVIGWIYWRSWNDLAQLIEAETSLAQHHERLEGAVEQRTAEAEEARKRAEEASASRSAFVASMSHEIRTPLSGVIGVANLLADTELKPEQREYLETILYSGEYLLMIVNEVLDLSKIEAGKLNIRLMPTEPRKLIEETLDLFALKATETHLEMVAHLDPKVPRAVHLDRTRVRQVLVNLLGNALKFTETGQIKVSLQMGPAIDRETWLKFSVADSGPGIPTDQQNHLFEAFVQGTEHQERGTGLGLNISKRLVEMMGGRIWAENRPQGGANFCFVLPAKLAPSPQDPALSPDFSALKGRRLLLLSANEELGAALKDLLSPYHMSLIHSGDRAVLERELEAGTNLCGLAVDLRFGQPLPFDWIERLKAKFQALPVMVFACLGDRFDLPEGISLVRKPFHEETLLHSLQQTTPHRPNQGPPAPGLPNLAKVYPLKILLVEDNQVNQMLAQAMMQKFGFEPDLADNGQVAVEKATAHDYDLIFMDIRMPVLNGVEASKRILAALPPERQPIIVALTANLLAEDRETYEQAGMRGLLPKPITPKEVGSALSYWARTLKKQRHLAHLERPENNPPLINQAVLHSRLNVGGNFFESLRDQYQLMAPRLIEGMSQATHQGDDLGCMTEAHQLGGLSKNIGADQMAALCYQIEVAAHDNDLQQVAGLLLEMEPLYAQTTEALSAFSSPE